MEAPSLNLSGAVGEGPDDFKRPSHPDFMDSTELRKMRFSGIRHNSITDDCEIWVFGYIEAVVTKAELLLNPLAINQAIETSFSLHNVMPDSPAARQWERIKNEKGD